MSMSYWAIQGYGIRVNEITREFILDENWKEVDFYPTDLLDIAHSMNDTCIYYIDNGDSESYLIYTPRLFGEMSDEEKTFKSKEDVAKRIYELYKDYLTVDEQWVIDNIDYISEYGCS